MKYSQMQAAISQQRQQIDALEEQIRQQIASQKDGVENLRKELAQFGEDLRAQSQKNEERFQMLQKQVKEVIGNGVPNTTLKNGQRPLWQLVAEAIIENGPQKISDLPPLVRGLGYQSEVKDICPSIRTIVDKHKFFRKKKVKDSPMLIEVIPEKIPQQG